MAPTLLGAAFNGLVMVQRLLTQTAQSIIPDLANYGDSLLLWEASKYCVYNRNNDPGA